MQSSFTDPTLRQDILRVLSAALGAVNPLEAIRSHVILADDVLHIGAREYRLDDVERIFVVGGGKAGTPMTSALFDLLGQRITAGVVNVKYGHTAGAGSRQVQFGHSAAEIDISTTSQPALRPSHTGPIEIIEAGHPIPDSAGQVGATQIAALLQRLTPRDLVIVVISGGGSALLPLPVAGISLADYQALNTVLLRCGADITEFNTVRKHCSRLQGGQLARLAAPAQVATLILSDVVGSPLDAIASGPTVPDRSTFTEALAVLKRYNILDQVPIPVRTHLTSGAAGAVPDTPKPDDPLFERVVNVVVGDNASAGRAAVTEARRLGWHSALLTTFLQGEAREVGRVIAGLAQGVAGGQADFQAPVCLVLGGETTVTIRGEGLGGRNQELALAAAIALADFRPPAGMEVAVVSLATDGTDGPTDAAGGIATPDTVARGQARGLDARAALADNDSYHYLAALGDLILTGPTNTNVNDLVFAFCVG